MKLTDEDKRGLTPAEIEALESEQDDGDGLDDASGNAGETVNANDMEIDDGLGDDETPGNADEGAADDGSNKANPADTLSQEDLASLAADDDKPAPEVLAVPEDNYTDKLSQLKADKRTIEQQWSDGELSDEQRAEKLQEIDDQREALLAAKVKAETLAEINAQRVAQAQAREESEWNSAAAALAGDPKVKALVDYTMDASAVEQFDLALAAVAKSPSAKGLTKPELVAKAHAAVLAMRGIEMPKQSAQAPKQAPTRRDVPMTLGGLPQAARVEVGDDLEARFAKMSGPEAETFLASLPAAQQNKLMGLV